MSQRLRIGWNLAPPSETRIQRSSIERIDGTAIAESALGAALAEASFTAEYKG